MKYPELIKLKKSLIEKENKTPEELKLLSELQSLSEFFEHNDDFSLSLSDKVCKTCGRPL